MECVFKEKAPFNTIKGSLACLSGGKHFTRLLETCSLERSVEEPWNIQWTLEEPLRIHFLDDYSLTYSCSGI